MPLWVSVALEDHPIWVVAESVSTDLVGLARSPESPVVTLVAAVVVQPLMLLVLVLMVALALPAL
jgi:hypothetical protein